MKKPELWLSYAFNASFGCFVAIASSKHPALGDEKADVVAHSFQETEQGCRDWFEDLKRARPNMPHKTAGFLGHVCVATALSDGS